MKACSHEGVQQEVLVTTVLGTSVLLYANACSSILLHLCLLSQWESDATPDTIMTLPADEARRILLMGRTILYGK